jgi:hypothetical protein
MPGFEDLWFNKRDALLQEAEDIVSRALRSAGWRHTSQTPGSVWMWQIEIGGVTYSVSTDDAARMQEHWARDGYFEKYPDELDD